MIQARRPTSHFKDSQELPAALVNLVTESLIEEFGQDLPPQTVVSGRIFKNEILVRVGWPVDEGTLRHRSVEASIDFDPNTQNANERIHVCLDALQGSLEEFIDAEGDIEVPRFWNEFTFEKQKVYIQFSAVNAKLEDAADAFLKDHGFLEDGTEEAALLAASALAGETKSEEEMAAETVKAAETARGLKAIAEELSAHALKIQASLDVSGIDNLIDEENPFESPLLKRAKHDLELQTSSQKKH